MKVLIIANYSESAGGISGQVTLLHKNLRKEGIKADIFSTKLNWWKRVKLFNSLKRYAKKYDIIHVHCCSSFGFFPAILAYQIAKSNKQKLVLTYHGGGAEEFFSSSTKLVKFFLNRTNYNIVLSGFLENIFKKYNIPCTVIPNIIEDDGSKPKVRIKVEPRFVSVRTLEPNYNVACIIKAFEIVKKTLHGATLDILSDGSCRTDLENYVKSHGIEGIKFLGTVSHSSIHDYLSNNDVFISMPLIDNQPMSILEAWRNGLLVISSNVGGVPYLVDDGKSGILVESDNHRALAEAMIKAVQNQERSLEIIRNGSESLKKYSWDKIRTQIINIYSK